jgi:hydrogenase maturation protein HypF
MPDPDSRRGVLALLDADGHCPPSSGLGRLFDAAAALLGLAERNSFEAQSGMALEAAAARAAAGPSGEGLMPLVDGDPAEIDHRPLVARLLDLLERGETAGRLAWLFHDAVADGLARAAAWAAEGAGLSTAGLTGGVFGNALLTELTAARLAARGLTVLLHREVPPNDGGIALGQAAVAAAWLSGSDARSTR